MGRGSRRQRDVKRERILHTTRECRCKSQKHTPNSPSPQHIPNQPVTTTEAKACYGRGALETPRAVRPKKKKQHTLVRWIGTRKHTSSPPCRSRLLQSAATAQPSSTGDKGPWGYQGLKGGGHTLIVVTETGEGPTVRFVLVSSIPDTGEFSSSCTYSSFSLGPTLPKYPTSFAQRHKYCSLRSGAPAEYMNQKTEETTLESARHDGKKSEYLQMAPAMRNRDRPKRPSWGGVPLNHIDDFDKEARSEKREEE